MGAVIRKHTIFHIQLMKVSFTQCISIINLTLQCPLNMRLCKSLAALGGGNIFAHPIYYVM